MNRILLWSIAMITLSCLCNCSQPNQFGDKEIQVFDHEFVQFKPDDFKKLEPDAKGTIRLSGGRVLLKKVSIPNFDLNTKVTAKVILASAGDRWDKSGSLFVLPKEKVTNILTIAKKEAKFPQIKNKKNPTVGAIAAQNYKPAVELLRFMTPFGVGAYSDSITFRHRKPVYIPHWEKDVRWEEEITQLISTIEGEVWIGVWIDTWTKEGYVIDVKLEFDESKIIQDLQPKTEVISLVNAVPYVGEIKGPSIFAHKDMKTSFTLPEGAKNVRLYYTTTGHGGHSGGDEFVKQENILKVDGESVFKFTPWRDDCAQFRRFNPGTGVWLIKDTAQYIDWKTWKYKQKVIEERLGSSDLSRSNWCPGSKVSPVVVPLNNIKAGQHSFTISIPNAQPTVSGELNHWLVAAYIVYEK